MKKLFVVLAAMLTFTSTAFAALGSLDSDLVYTPVTPCRIFDTRLSQGGTGPIAAGGTRNFNIWGAASYAGQGGAASDCGITAGSSTAAVAVNFTVVSPATSGYITAFPFGTTKPLAATVNFNAGDVRGNFSIAKNSQAGASALSVFSTSNVEVIGDVVGYYSRPVAAGSLECIVPIAHAFSVPAGFSSFHYSTATCSAGYVAVSAYCYNNDSPDLYSTGSGIDGGAWCGWRNATAAAIDARQSTNCCRIPGR